MADQGRWFKLWCSAPADDSIQALPVPLRWAWVAFGAYTKVHGTSGIVRLKPSNAVLAGQLGVAPSALLETLGSLPGIYLGTAPVRWPHGHEKRPVCEGEFMRGAYPPTVRGTTCLEEWCRRHGELVVTWENWTKYQEDSTQAQRGIASRSKKRGEEKRGEETKKRREPTPGRPPLTVEDLIQELTSQEAYRHIDVRGGVLRCEQFWRAKGKELTRSRAVGWLNGDARDRVAGNGARPPRAGINETWKTEKTGDIKL